jgi:hypothetical protein
MHWHGVPEDKQDEWRRAFGASRDGIVLSVPCPCCGANALRRFYSRGVEDSSHVVGLAVRGSSWEWCFACGAFEHASCLIPSWWMPVRGVREEVLTALPQEVHQQLVALGVA